MRRSILVVGIVLLMGLLSGCGGIGDAFNKTGYDLIVGTTGEEDGIEEVQTRFRTGEEITFELDGDKSIGSSLVKVMVFKRSNDVETIVDSGDVEIDPSWNWMTYVFGQFQETGDYTIRVFDTDDVLLGETDFMILP